MANIRSAVPDTVLAEFALSDTGDLDEFARQLAELYYPARLRPAASVTGRQRCEVRAVRGDSLTVGYVRPGQPVSLAPYREFTTYHVNIPLSGALRATSGEQDLVAHVGTAVLFSADHIHQLHEWGSSTAVIGLKLGRDMVERQLERLIDSPVASPIRFDPAFDLSSPGGASWLAVLGAVLDILGRPAGLATSPEFADSLVRSLALGLLVGQRHNFSPQIEQRGGPPRPRTVGRAIRHIEERFAEPLTLADLAVAAGCGPRRLQDAFQTYLDLSPMAYLLGVRLDHARKRLKDGEPSVSAVAGSCGFGHLGRFAGYYRARYGELPSATIRG